MKAKMTKALEQKLEEQAGRTAMGDVLSAWPDDMSFTDVLQNLDEATDVDDVHEDIVAWQPHEHLCPASLAELLRETYQNQYRRLLYAVETAFNI